MRRLYPHGGSYTLRSRLQTRFHNRETICRIIEEYEKKGAELLVFRSCAFPDIPVTICSKVGDPARTGKEELKESCGFPQRDGKCFCLPDFPGEHEGKLYNVAAAICDGELLGLVTKHQYAELFRVL